MLTPDVLASLHDLGNLLTVIDATTERIRMRRPEDHSCDSLLADLVFATKRATEIVWEMKCGARAHADTETMDAVNVVEGLQRSLTTIVGPNVALAVVARVPNARVVANRRMIEQAIYNLVSNARDAMKSQGSIDVIIEVLPVRGSDSIGNALAAGDFAAISVRDTGPGFNVASVPKLFEPFFTTKPTGTGLGLRLVADVARTHQGGVFVISEPGHGATFTLVVPLAALDTGSELS